MPPAHEAPAARWGRVLDAVASLRSRAMVDDRERCLRDLERKCHELAHRPRSNSELGARVHAQRAVASWLTYAGLVRRECPRTNDVARVVVHEYVRGRLVVR